MNEVGWRVQKKGRLVPRGYGGYGCNMVPTIALSFTDWMIFRLGLMNWLIFVGLKQKLFDGFNFGFFDGFHGF